MIAEWTEWLVNLGVPAAAIAGAVGGFHAWARGEVSAALRALGLGLLGVGVLSNLDTLGGWIIGPAGESTPVRHVEAPSVLPWLLLGVPAALAAVFAVLGLVRLGKRRQGKRRTVREADAAAQARRHAIESDHDEVTDAYGAYLCDILAVLDRPALDDVTVPQTAALLHALDAADDARRGVDLDTYRQAVSNLKTAWRTADEHARKTGTAHLPASDRAAVSKARALFEKALDDRGSEYERQAAHAKARALLGAVLTIPRQAAAAVEHQTRPALAVDATA
ncbi:hypothetical protein [Streptomyces sp. NPDC053541]|uniref:hypothetical protein n=1 Tax=Streptomyces sp. NPDC053541 TaxID=3365709 RepID=UPI0037D586A5